jgi:hypothetical protein
MFLIWNRNLNVFNITLSYFFTVGENKMDEEAKIKHSKRILQKENHVKRQLKIAKAHNIPVKEPHTLQDHSALTCGDSNCVMCGNPRKMFKEVTFQEQKMNIKEKFDSEC